MSATPLDPLAKFVHRLAHVHDRRSAHQEGFRHDGEPDAWWAAPLVTFIVFASFVVYVTWAAHQGTHYRYGPYLSPFYSPELFGDPEHAWFGGKPDWYPSFLPFSPALFILWAPGLFRFTCYYYRGAYYKAFWADPPSCAVGEPRRSYCGETAFPLIMQNIHRYFCLVALFFLPILIWDVWEAFWFPTAGGGRTFGIGIGTLVLAANTTLLGGYVLGCHSFRHAVGGGVDKLAAQPLRKKCYDGVSCLNRPSCAVAAPADPTERGAGQREGRRFGYGRNRRVSHARAQDHAIEIGVGETGIDVDVGVGRGSGRFGGRSRDEGLRLRKQGDGIQSTGPNLHVRGFGDVGLLAGSIAADLEALGFEAVADENPGNRICLERTFGEQVDIQLNRNELADGGALHLEVIKGRGAGSGPEKGVPGTGGRCEDAGNRLEPRFGEGRGRYARSSTELAVRCFQEGVAFGITEDAGRGERDGSGSHRRRGEDNGRPQAKKWDRGGRDSVSPAGMVHHTTPYLRKANLVNQSPGPAIGLRQSASVWSNRNRAAEPDRARTAVDGIR